MSPSNSTKQRAWRHPPQRRLHPKTELHLGLGNNCPITPLHHQSLPPTLQYCPAEFGASPSRDSFPDPTQVPRLPRWAAGSSFGGTSHQTQIQSYESWAPASFPEASMMLYVSACVCMCFSPHVHVCFQSCFPSIAKSGQLRSTVGGRGFKKGPGEGAQCLQGPALQGCSRTLNSSVLSPCLPLSSSPLRTGETGLSVREEPGQ